MSVIPLKPDIHQRGLHVCFVPEADMRLSASTISRAQAIKSTYAVHHKRNL
jgi:hypothetical protein